MKRKLEMEVFACILQNYNTNRTLSLIVGLFESIVHMGNSLQCADELTRAIRKQDAGRHAV